MIIRALLFYFTVAVAVANAGSFDYSLKVETRDGKLVSLQKYKGKPLLIIYFSTSCSHCKEALAVLNTFKADPCITIFGIVTGSDSLAAFTSFAAKKSFPHELYYDRKKQFKDHFSIEHVPATVFIARNGNVLFERTRTIGKNFTDVLAAGMSAACGKGEFQKTMGGRYYGEAVCAVCHQKVDAWWQTSPHADAFKPIAKKFCGRSGYREGYFDKVDPECLPCHTVGYEEPSGYDVDQTAKHLLGVQCESCHSAAGPHDKMGVTDYESQCLRCHTSQRDPGFSFRTKMKKLGHIKE